MNGSQSCRADLNNKSYEDLLELAIQEKDNNTKLAERILIEEVCNLLDETDTINEATLDSENSKVYVDTMKSENKKYTDRRWKLAMFCLGFLSNKKCNEFFEKYYDGQTDGKVKAREWSNKSRKIKIAKIKELASNLDPKLKDAAVSRETHRKFLRNTHQAAALIMAAKTNVHYQKLRDEIIDNLDSDPLKDTEEEKKVFTKLGIFGLVSGLIASVLCMLINPAGVLMGLLFAAPTAVAAGAGHVQAKANELKTIKVTKDDIVREVLASNKPKVTTNDGKTYTLRPEWNEKNNTNHTVKNKPAIKNNKPKLDIPYLGSTDKLSISTEDGGTEESILLKWKNIISSNPDCIVNTFLTKTLLYFNSLDDDLWDKFRGKNEDEDTKSTVYKALKKDVLEYEKNNHRSPKELYKKWFPNFNVDKLIKSIEFEDVSMDTNSISIQLSDTLDRSGLLLCGAYATFDEKLKDYYWDNF